MPRQRAFGFERAHSGRLNVEIGAIRACMFRRVVQIHNRHSTGLSIRPTIP